MGTRLVVVRHGNTFDKGQISLRVGARTDIPLSGSGREQATILGRYLRLSGLEPDVVFSSELARAYETAIIALKEAGFDRRVEKLGIFNEVDYGPDEAKTEEEVIARIGTEAMELWNRAAVVPDGWIFDPDGTVKNWKNFATQVDHRHRNGLAMVFTSNGIARFAPHLTGNFEKFSEKFDIKMSTGAISIFEKSENEEYWNVVKWNLKPKDHIRI
ncbi:MAG: histidine phosphatase family protein [Rickettsiales bacterium]|jgi:probable phosphoglycerate mutase|nr:histidine phosphatase family protein [Rickettsiales bacterium]